MTEQEKYMLRCHELALKGLGSVDPNPLVGSVIVYQGKIIGEGYHHRFGGPHAEVEAIKSVKDQDLLKESTLYVNLEPCAHHGKTPPCSDLIISKKIPRVVIGCRDPFDEVNGKGIERLKAAGIEVTTVLEKESQQINKRFLCFHEKKRPYILLKWAQTSDGFIDRKRENNLPHQNRISGAKSKTLVHLWRSQEAAILVGKNTVLFDDPELTVREVSGRNPVRIIFDRDLEIPSNRKIFQEGAPTLVLNAKKEENKGHLTFCKIDFSRSLQELFRICCEKGLISILVEGGEKTLNNFIEQDLWDEAIVFQSAQVFHEGIRAPQLKQDPVRVEPCGEDLLFHYYRTEK